MGREKCPNWNPHFINKEGVRFNIRHFVWRMDTWEDGLNVIDRIKEVGNSLLLNHGAKMSIALRISMNTTYVLLLWTRTLPKNTYRIICGLLEEAMGSPCSITNAVRDMVERAIQEWDAPADCGFILQDEIDLPYARTFLFDTSRPACS